MDGWILAGRALFRGMVLAWLIAMGFLAFVTAKQVKRGIDYVGEMRGVAEETQKDFRSLRTEVQQHLRREREQQEARRVTASSDRPSVTGPGDVVRVDEAGQRAPEEGSGAGDRSD